MTEIRNELRGALSERYRVEREIGRGGMATVYLAHDLRHQRLVALKVLDPELGAVLGVERFLSEIRVTANLQHPNLLPLFDSGEAAGLLFYVMPYVEGESLRTRLDREKQLPVGQAVEIAGAIAGALDYAHRRGVIHRDLKPENVLLHEGKPLVADFGIALAVSHAGGQRVTQTGLSLGTPQYMSPEQATGDRVIDARSDIYSLGALLYEMLVGDPPYLGGTAQAIIAKVLTERPQSVRALRPTVPAHVAASVERALEKLPADRFATARELADALQGTSSFEPVKASGAPSASSSRARSRTIPAALALGAAAGILGFFAGSRSQDRAAVREPRFYNVVLPESALFVPARDRFDDVNRAIAISRDGRSLIYSAQVGAATRLMLARLDLGSFTPVRGAEGSVTPAFSPDARSIAFVTASNELKRLSLGDGAVSALGNLPVHADIVWGSDGLIYGSSPVVCAWTIPASGGPRSPLFGGACSAGPLALIDGTEWSVASIDGVLSVASRKTSERRPLRVPSVAGDSGAPLLGDAPLLAGDYLAFVRDSTLYAAKFDTRALRLTSEPEPVLAGVRNDASRPQIALATDGTLAWVQGGDGTRARFVWVDSSGTVRDSVFVDRVRVNSYAISSDGKRLAFNTTGADGRPVLHVASIDRRVVDEIKTGVMVEPADWTDHDRAVLVKVHRPDGSMRRGLIRWRDGVAALDTSETSYDNASADGTLRCLGDGAQAVEVWKRDEPATRVRLQDRGGQWCRFSPDGRYVTWVAQTSIYVASTDSTGTANRVQVATGGADEPRWSADGKRIYYRNGNRWYVVDVPRPGAAPVTSRLLFEGHYLQAWTSWALGPDGRFLLLSTPTPPPARTLNVITDFPAFVERKLGRTR